MKNFVENASGSSMSQATYDDERPFRLRPDELVSGATYFARLLLAFDNGTYGSDRYAKDFEARVEAVDAPRNRLIFPGLIKPTVRVNLLPVAPREGRTPEEGATNPVMSLDGLLFRPAIPIILPFRVEAGYLISAIDEANFAPPPSQGHHAPEPVVELAYNH